MPAALYTIALFYGGCADIGLPTMPEVPFDKITHFGAFLGLEWLLELALAEAAAAPRRRAAVTMSAGAGGLLELAQAALPYRSAEWLDLLADSLGALAGAWLLMLLVRWRTPGAAEASRELP
ncbi:VanZ family protein [Sorangium cellulosum]|uniref:VanZ family protein n=1 Tax=Sorangium cellulosum TaxID=56 RepID=UPI0013312ED3|nr:VanZ family protein [Sorangium cellulosum]